MINTEKSGPDLGLATRDVDYTIDLCITCIMYQQLWGYKVEEKLYLGVREQRRLNTTGLAYVVTLLLLLSLEWTERRWSWRCGRNVDVKHVLKSQRAVKIMFALYCVPARFYLRGCGVKQEAVQLKQPWNATLVSSVAFKTCKWLEYYDYNICTHPLPPFTLTSRKYTAR
jgi:hypothetical protein